MKLEDSLKKLEDAPEINAKKHEKLHMAYGLMKNLLIEMHNYGDLEGWDTDDIFKLIDELEEDNQ